MHVQQLARSCFLGRGCCDNPSGMGSGANASLVYFFSIEFTSECFQRMTGLFCGTLGDALGDTEGGKVLGRPPGCPGGLPEQPCPGPESAGCRAAGTATSHSSFQWFSCNEDIIPLLSSIYAPTETRVVFVCLSKLKLLIPQSSAGGLGRAIATRHCCSSIKLFK